jgi:hypothetical protein
MTDSEEPIRLDMIVGLTGSFIDNASLGPPSIRPIVTLNLVDQSGRIVLLPLSDIAFQKILDTLQRIAQGFDDPNMPGPFEPPKMQ